MYVLTVRSTTFCAECGRTIRGGLLRRPVACPACGAGVTSDAGAVASPPPPPSAGDSALDTTHTFVIERPVLPEPGNPAPAYPTELRMRGVEGETLLQFVVDTMGRARMSSARVLRASDSAFARAAIGVLPRYRFTVAMSHDRRVAQIVQLPFEFRLAR